MAHTNITEVCNIPDTEVGSARSIRKDIPESRSRLISGIYAQDRGASRARERFKYRRAGFRERKRIARCAITATHDYYRKSQSPLEETNDVPIIRAGYVRYVRTQGDRDVRWKGGMDARGWAERE